MDIRSVIPLSVAAAALALGTGCAGGKFWKDKDSAATAWKVPEGVPTAPLSSAARGESGVVQAGGTMPAASSTTTPAFAWLTGKGDKAGKAAKVPAAVLITAWQNKVEYLPDPSRGGAMGPGLVGQLFLFAPDERPAPANGTLTVDLYDDTLRPAGQPGLKPERWEFTKDVLKTLLTVDERFGPCYALFLPWPTYRPDVTRVRIAVRFDPERGYTVYAPETKLTLDNSPGGASAPVQVEHFSVPQPSGGFTEYGRAPAGPGPGLGVMTTGGRQPTSAPAGPAGPLSPAAGAAAPPPGFGSLAPAGNPGVPNIPADLPPLAIIASPGPR